MRLENTFIGADGVGEVTERSLWESGVTHWNEFAGEAVGPKTAANIDAYLANARDRLSAGDADFFMDALPSTDHWRAYPNFRSNACFLDIETTGLNADRDRVTTVSLYRNGEIRTLVRGDDLSRAALREQLAPAPLLVTYNGSRFDLPFLEQTFDLSITTPHLDVMGVCHGLDITGGLAAAERAFGITRDQPDLSGRDAVRLWREYEAGRDGALETLISYNREDTKNLQTILDQAVAHHTAHVFPQAERIS